MPRIQSFTSSSPPYSPSLVDRQFCLTGQQTSSMMNSATEGKARMSGQRKMGVMEMPLENHDMECGSDTDSGKGTVTSEVIESPTRDSPSQPFPGGGGGVSGGVIPRYELPPSPAKQRSRGGREAGDTFYKNRRTVNEDDRDDGCPVSPTSEINYDFNLGSLSEGQYLSRGSQHGAYGYVFPVDKVSTVQTEDDVLWEGGNSPKVSPLFPGISSDKNNNNLAAYSGMNRYEMLPVTELHATGTNAFEPRHLSHKPTPEGLSDSRDTLTGSSSDAYSGPDAMRRRELQAKCKDLFGSRNNVFGSREIHSRLGSRQDLQASSPDRSPRPRSDGFAPFSDHDHWTLQSIESQDTVFDTSSSDGIIGNSGAYDVTSQDAVHAVGLSGSYDRHSDVSYGPNDSLSTVYIDYTPTHTPSETYERRYVRHMVTNPQTTKQWDSPSKGYRYTKRHHETSFNSPMGSDPQLHESGGPRAIGGSPGRLSAAEYRRNRSVSYEYPPNGDASWRGDRMDTPSRGLALHPALQQPFFDEAPATLPRPNKPDGRRKAAMVSDPRVTPNTSPEKDRHHRPARRWTNLGLSEAETGQESNNNSPSSKSSRSSTRSAVWLNISSILRQKKHHQSNTSLASETKPEYGIELERIATTDTRRSLQSAFEAAHQDTFRATASVPVTPVKNDQFLRSSSYPNPEVNPGSPSMSLLQRIRFRLNPNSRKKNPSTTITDVQRHHPDTTPKRYHHADDPDDVTPNEDQSSDAIRVANEAGISYLRFHSLQEPSNEQNSRDQVVNFATLQPPRSKADRRDFRDLELNQEFAEPRPSTSMARAASSSGHNTSHGSVVNRHHFSVHHQKQARVAPPSEVLAVLSTVDQVISLVEHHATTSDTDTDGKTIREEDFIEHQHNMVESLKEFIDRCKILFIKAPSSCSGFLEELPHCQRSLDVVTDRYCFLVDCTSLPADRSKFAVGVNTMVMSFRQAVVSASEAAGRTALHPAARRLGVRLYQLVGDLKDLMRLVREMNYNRLSRRF